MVSHLVGRTEKGLGVPMISEVLVINRDKDDAKTVRASITSTCAASFDIASKKGAKLGPADWNLCRDNTLSLKKESGWAELTTSMIQDGAELSIIEIDSASWSGVVPSPVP
jgi:ketopantoate reductase